MEVASRKSRKKYIVVHFHDDDSIVDVNWKANYDSGMLVFGDCDTVKVKFGNSWSFINIWIIMIILTSYQLYITRLNLPTSSVFINQF